MKFIFATHNANKLAEVRAMLPSQFSFSTLTELNYHTEIPETRDTIVGNALQKVETVWDIFKENCFAEDTGLLVKSLNDEPNVFTARYAGEHKSSADNISLLLKNLAPHEDRTAKFVTVFALIIGGKSYTFEGVCEGTIATSPRGEGGFGYDPVFIPKGYQTTFAEMNSEEKHSISHRGKALAKMVDFIRELAIK